MFFSIFLMSSCFGVEIFGLLVNLFKSSNNVISFYNFSMNELHECCSFTFEFIRR